MSLFTEGRRFPFDVQPDAQGVQRDERRVLSSAIFSSDVVFLTARISPWLITSHVRPELPDEFGPTQRNRDSNQPILGELIAVLKPHPRGLRRWSVMRAIRANRSRVSRDIPLQFEADVESVFRKFSSDVIDAHTRVCELENAPLHRPTNSAGEVWALHSGRAETTPVGENLTDSMRFVR